MVPESKAEYRGWRAMKYHDPPVLDRERAVEELKSGVPERIGEALVSVALHDADSRWVQEQCLELASHPSAAVRSISATCLGHVARIHRELELERVLPVLAELRLSPETEGAAQDALDDIEMFLGRAARAGRRQR